MSRLTSNQIVDLMEAYNLVYTPQVNEDYLWESYLTEEFISEAYQTVADYLVQNGFVPGYNTAEIYMSEMAVEDIDEILFETGVLDEQYLMEAGFFQNLANTAIGGVKRAGSAVAGGVRSVASGADRAVGGAVRAGQAAAGAVQRAGSAVAGGVQRAGQTVAGAAQRAGGAVQRAVTPVAQAVQGTAQRAVAAGQSALGSAGRAIQGAGQAVAGGVQRAGSAIAGGAAAAGRRIGQEIEISRKVGAGEPLNKPTPAPTAAKPTQTPQRGLGNIPPSEGTGIGGPSDLARKYGRDTTSYQAGGGARSGRGIQPTMQQGRTNLGRMDQGRPAPSGAKPTSGPSAVNPKSGVAGFPASRPTAPAARPTAPAARPTAPAATTGNPPLKPPALPPITGKPSLRSGIADIKAMQAASRQRQGLTQSFDPFDMVLGHLIDEGYADTEEAALKIMANMSDGWREEILEGRVASEKMSSDERRRARNDEYREENPTLPSGNPMGPNAQLMRQMAHAKKRGVKKRQ